LEFSISEISSFGQEESSIPVSSSAELGFRRWKASSVELVQSEYFGRSISDGISRSVSFSRSRSGVVIEMDTLHMIRASIRRRMTKWLIAWAYITWVGPT